MYYNSTVLPAVLALVKCSVLNLVIGVFENSILWHRALFDKSVACTLLASIIAIMIDVLLSLYCCCQHVELVLLGTLVVLVLEFLTWLFYYIVCY